MQIVFILLVLASMYGGYRAKDVIEGFRDRRKQKRLKLRSPNDIVDDMQAELADDLAEIMKKQSNLRDMLTAIAQSNDAAGNIDRRIAQLPADLGQLCLEGGTTAAAPPEAQPAVDTDDEIIISIEGRRGARRP